MNLFLEQRLIEEGVEFARLAKREKVKLLGRWCQTFPELRDSARAQQSVPTVALGADADQSLCELQTVAYYVFPDDASGMPSYRCVSARMPNLVDLVSDMETKCDEIVVVDVDFHWSAVLVNHGSPQSVGRHYLRR